MQYSLNSDKGTHIIALQAIFKTLAGLIGKFLGKTPLLYASSYFCLVNSLLV